MVDDQNDGRSKRANLCWLSLGTMSMPMGTMSSWPPVLTVFNKDLSGELKSHVRCRVLLGAYISMDYMVSPSNA